jgi:hypothetical protein
MDLAVRFDHRDHLSVRTLTSKSMPMLGARVPPREARPAPAAGWAGCSQGQSSSSPEDHVDSAQNEGEFLSGELTDAFAQRRPVERDDLRRVGDRLLGQAGRIGRATPIPQHHRGLPPGPGGRFGPVRPSLSARTPAASPQRTHDRPPLRSARRLTPPRTTPRPRRSLAGAPLGARAGRPKCSRVPPKSDSCMHASSGDCEGASFARSS